MFWSYNLLRHSCLERYTYLSFSWSVNGKLDLLYMFFTFSYIYRTTNIIKCNSRLKSKIDFFLSDIFNLQLNHCFVMASIHNRSETSFKHCLNLLLDSAQWDQVNYKDEQIGFSHINFPNRPLNIQHAKSPFLGATGLEPTRCSETRITTASLQYLRTFIRKERELVCAYGNHSGSL